MKEYVSEMIGFLSVTEVERVREAFDADFYRIINPDVRKSSLDPFEHYTLHGWREDREPTPYFDTIYYKEHYAKEIGDLPAFVHYVLFGQQKGYQPNRASGLTFLGKVAKDYARIKDKFDGDFYCHEYEDVCHQYADPLLHFCMIGWKEGRKPRSDFDVGHYLAQDSWFLSEGVNPYVEYVEGRLIDGGNTSVDRAMWMFMYETIRANFDDVYYSEQLKSVGVVFSGDYVAHYLENWRVFLLNPARDFSSAGYLEANSDVNDAGINPYYHYLTQGKMEGRSGLPENALPIQNEFTSDVCVYPDMHVYGVIKEAFDSAFYLQHTQLATEEDPVVHYLNHGWLDGLDPSPDFSTSYYVAVHKDVKDAKINPFFHFLVQGKKEGRKTHRSLLAQNGQDNSSLLLLKEHQKYTAPGEDFELFDSALGEGKKALLRGMAFYLPQFYQFEENDQWWGAGFTEWRNVARGVPRYVGHVQPRIPMDLGYYDLTDARVISRQADLAKKSGLEGFCFYYYSFNGKRLLDKPVEIFLANKSIDASFLLIWANENWTRTWDGHNQSVLISQDYRDSDEDDLLIDIARHFEDSRYFKINGRHLFVIYRPGLVPDAKVRFARWRTKWKALGFEPLIFMAQGFNDHDPGCYGLDGAMEFPPHKVAAGLSPMNQGLDLLDSHFSGNVLSYEQMINNSKNEGLPEYPLIKGVTLGWDNEARRPGKGMSFLGADPHRYESWLRSMVGLAKANPVYGDSVIVINAWNEWAEGAYLEPDVYYGSAYLNATARALFGVPVDVHAAGKFKLLLVGHDAYRHGAQILLLNIGKLLKNKFGMEVAFLIIGEGPLIKDYSLVGECLTLNKESDGSLEGDLIRIQKKGYRAAILNTAVSGKIACALHEVGFLMVSLIHELPTLLREYHLETSCKNIALHSSHIVFPAGVVKEGFLEIVETIAGQDHVRPQGLYKNNIRYAGVTEKGKAREILGVPSNAKVVINVGYADARKGFDIFFRVALDMISDDEDLYFIWVGDATPDIKNWLLSDLSGTSKAAHLMLTGFVANVECYYAAADVFFMTSREDPFPSVVLEALQAGLPVVGLKGSGGCDALCASYGALVEKTDVTGMAFALSRFLEQSRDPHASSLMAADRVALIDRYFRFDDYCADLLRMITDRYRKVSVIVPNYNYGYCMKERLGGIFGQNFPIFEIIVLDDKSTDNSVDVINALASSYGRDISLIVNEENSGSVFKQWGKGVNLARGDYIWIAEADDVSAPNFLSVLVDVVSKNNSAFGFCDSWQIDADGTRIGDTYKPYMNAGFGSNFDDSFVSDGAGFVGKFLAVKNVILNVSGVVWEKRALVEAMEEVGDDLFSFKVAGDWRLYIQACCKSGATVSYVSQALNGHRRHSSSVTHALSNRRHYDEIVEIQKIAQSFTAVDESIKLLGTKYLEEVRSYLKVAAPLG